MTTWTLEPLGYIHGCFPDKFGIPRQPLLAPSAKARLVLQAPYSHPDCFEGLEQSSHLWLTFIFHQHIQQGWKPKVRPPRLGGNKKCGVFASRSSFRPNHLGLSVVKLDQISTINRQVVLHLSGVDLLDGTPIVDIKPYIPYADSVLEANNDFAREAPKFLGVIFSQQAHRFCLDLLDDSQRLDSYPTDDVKQLIIEVLQQDPRPAYQDDHGRVYKMSLLDMTIEWCCRLQDDKQAIEVIRIRLNA